MKVLNVQQLKDADAFTVLHEPIEAINLMERAAGQCVAWLLDKAISEKAVYIFCGKGGNGGDGLAIARMLALNGIETRVFILETGAAGTAEFETNRERLNTFPVSIQYIEAEDTFPQIAPGVLVVDALFGFGLDRPLHGMPALLIEHLNNSGAEIISIDLPSGLFADRSSKGNSIVKATHTVTFECYKLALLMPENASYTGCVHVLPIQLHPRFMEQVPAAFELLDENIIKKIFRPRNRFAHKGTFGHALLIGGSYGKIGAMVLATSACLRSGAGLVSSYIPKCGYPILQLAAPEAMTITDSNETILTQPLSQLEPFAAIGIGPGMGTAAETGAMLYALVAQCRKPMVIDADALNLLAQQPHWLAQLFQNTILTPHPKEFERLFGACTNDFNRVALACKKAIELNCILVLKGHHTLIALPDGKAYFNSTGNAGMAKGGSGDVLTGTITALLAQSYLPAEAAVIGVYIHGLAGDFAAQALSQEAMTPRDTIASLSNVFLKMNG